MLEGESMEIEIFVEGEGLIGVEAIRVPTGSAGREIVVAIAARGGFPVEDGLLFVEDCDEPLDLLVILTKEASGKVHHVHRARHIEVSVFYQGGHLTHQFSPSTRVQRVLDWAVGPNGFKIDSAVAPEMELSLHESTAALPKDAHIGRYIHHPDHRIVFDLIRGVVPNGA
jgi:hypothetical protein